MESFIDPPSPPVTETVLKQSWVNFVWIMIVHTFNNKDCRKTQSRIRRKKEKKGTKHFISVFLQIIDLKRTS